MADDSFKHQVLEATDIVELISQTVALKRRGAKYIGLCPFHQEKTPSFNVDATKGYYKCFGCKEGGNAIDFVMKRDRVQFLDALKALAERAGLEMPKFGISKEKTSERNLLLDAHLRAAEFFHKNLLGPMGQPARDYLASRGFNDETIRNFKIGYAPPGWDNLIRSKDMAGLPLGLMSLGGLTKNREKGGGGYDTFRNRLMFPIRDDNGRTIAFGGRVMPGSDDPAKYLNSPETPLFSKSKSIFGLDLARQRIVETRTVAICEGYTDVAMAHQFGATNVVAVLGTAMTDQHLGVLRRFADRIVLLFDADRAGEMAVNRAVELFLTQPIEIAIATIPEDLDPDEYLLKHGRDAFDALLKSAEDALAFKWKLLQRELSAAGNSLTGQQKAVESYLSLLASARGTGTIDAIRWGAVLTRVEAHTGIPMEQLTARFNKKPGLGGPGGGVPSGAGGPQSFGGNSFGRSGPQKPWEGKPWDGKPREGKPWENKPWGNKSSGGFDKTRQPFQAGGRPSYGHQKSAEKPTDFRSNRGPAPSVAAGSGGMSAEPDVPAEYFGDGAGNGVPDDFDLAAAGGTTRDETTSHNPASSYQKTSVSGAQLKAERQILGILLAEPARWMNVQTRLSPENFVVASHRRLAQFFWDRLRDEGEVPFAELLSELPDEEMRQVSLDLIDESEKLPDFEATLEGALRYFAELEEKSEEAKQRALAQRKDANLDEFAAFVRSRQQAVTDKDKKK